MVIEVIINLKERFVVRSIEEAVEAHNRYISDNCLGARGVYNSIILIDNVVSSYISYNGRVWDWNKEDNPFTKQTPSRKFMLKYFK